MNKWYMNKHEDDDIVISTRVRLARNLAHLPFQDKMTRKQQIELIEMVKRALETANLGNNKLEYHNLGDMSDFERSALVEQHLVSHAFIKNAENKQLILSSDNSVSIMVNEEDHIRLQVLANGMDLTGAYDCCSKIDDVISEQLSYAYDDTLGYLTVCPTNLGTGLRASVMLHAKGLELTGAMPSLMKSVSRLGLTIRGSYGEGTGVVGSTYQLSNQVTLGLSEETAIENLQNIASEIISTEKRAREVILKENIDMTDAIYRSYGIMKHARVLTFEECSEHCSNLRFGVSAGILQDITTGQINEINNAIGEATICADNKKRYSAKERDYLRAQTVRNLMT